MQFQKISILLHRFFVVVVVVVVVVIAPYLPTENSSLAPYFASKMLAFKTPPPPLSLGISNDLPRGGCGFFLELHIVPP